VLVHPHASARASTVELLHEKPHLFAHVEDLLPEDELGYAAEIATLRRSEGGEVEEVDVGLP
jgi:hypothetical protein